MNKLAELDQLIEQVLGIKRDMPRGVEVVMEADQVRTLKLPKWRISESWGSPGSEDREVINKFSKQIEGKTIGEKLNSLNDFVVGCAKDCKLQTDVPKALSNLVILDSLSSMITDFNAQTGGFLLEAFLAGLLGGIRAEQLSLTNSSPQLVGTADLILRRGDYASLKFLSPNTQIEGSADLLKGVVERLSKPMSYFLVQKQKSSKTVVGLKVYEFTIGNSLYPGDINYEDYLITKTTTRDGEEIKSQPHWRFNQSLVIKDDFFRGELTQLSKPELRKIADSYAAVLEGRILTIFDELDKLNGAISDYLIAGEKSRAADAQRHARTLEEKVVEST